MATNGASRWQMQNGRWSAGWNAPGGWNAYRRMGRGQRLPNYWLRADFRIPDYLSFGLAAPPRGYNWVRYYDDAVLVDDRGDVWDSVGGIAWTDIEITREPSGQPRVLLTGECERIAKELGINRWHVSLSHIETHATASAIGLR